MKKKIFAALMAVMLAVTALAVSAAAFEFKNDDSMSFGVKPTKEAVEKMVEAYILQEKMGFVKTGTRPLTVSFDNDKGYIMLLATEYESVTMSGGSIFYLEATRIYAYYWSNEGWTYETYGAKAAKMGVYRQYFYYSADPVEAYGTYSAFEGINDTITYGTSELNATEILSYYQTLYDYVTNYETNLESAEQDGYNEGYTVGHNQGHTAGYDKGIEAGYDIGYEAGQAECESGHEAMTDEAYSKGYAKGNEDGFDDGVEMGTNVGYDMGYETGYDEGYETGYVIGLYDCDKTHEAMLQEARDFAYTVGYTAGASDCEEYHEEMESAAYEEGYLAGKQIGYDDGYSVGYQATKGDLARQYTKGYNNGKEAGITEAVNTKETVIDYVDGLFSAPVNFLYTMLDVEIFGMNLFNIVMVFTTVVIVGVVMTIILKFRR